MRAWIGRVGSHPVSSHGPLHYTPKRQQSTGSSTTAPFPLPVELLLHALGFLMGTHSLRCWRTAAEDLLSLRAASRCVLSSLCVLGQEGRTPTDQHSINVH